MDQEAHMGPSQEEPGPNVIVTQGMLDEKRRSGTRDRGFSHLTYQELLERKQKGLCYKCGGPFHKMHQCPDKHLRVMVIDEDEDGNEDGRLLAVEVEEEQEEEVAELSIMSLRCLANSKGVKSKTIKLEGHKECL